MILCRGEGSEEAIRRSMYHLACPSLRHLRVCLECKVWRGWSCVGLVHCGLPSVPALKEGSCIVEPQWSSLRDFCLGLTGTAGRSSPPSSSVSHHQVTSFHRSPYRADWTDQQPTWDSIPFSEPLGFNFVSIFGVQSFLPTSFNYIPYKHWIVAPNLRSPLLTLDTHNCLQSYLFKRTFTQSLIVFSLCIYEPLLDRYWKLHV